MFLEIIRNVLFVKGHMKAEDEISNDLFQFYSDELHGFLWLANGS